MLRRKAPLWSTLLAEKVDSWDHSQSRDGHSVWLCIWQAGAAREPERRRTSKSVSGHQISSVNIVSKGKNTKKLYLNNSALSRTEIWVSELLGKQLVRRSFQPVVVTAPLRASQTCLWGPWLPGAGLPHTPGGPGVSLENAPPRLAPVSSVSIIHTGWSRSLSFPAEFAVLFTACHRVNAEAEVTPLTGPILPAGDQWQPSLWSADLWREMTFRWADQLAASDGSHPGSQRPVWETMRWFWEGITRDGPAAEACPTPELRAISLAIC